ERGAEESVTGVNAAMRALGVLAMAMVLPRLVPRLVATGGALFWPAVLNQPWIAYPVLFLWGGIFVGIFTLMMTLVGSRFDGADLVGISVVVGLVGGVGALLGPGPRWYLDGRPATRPAHLHPLGHARFHGLRSHKPQRGMIPRDWFSIKANRLLIAVV